MRTVERSQQSLPQSNFQGTSPLIVSYHTPGYYTQVANERLLPSVRALGIEHDVREVLLGEGWAKRTQFKAEFLQHMRAEHIDRDLLWVDVDAVIHANPLEQLRDGYAHCDIAVHKLRGNELLSGTIWLPAAGLRTDELLDEWREQCRRHGDAAWDQRCLAKAIEELERTGPLIVGELPPQFCYIFDTSRRYYPGVSPIIEHFQASRKLRRQGGQR